MSARQAFTATPGVAALLIQLQEQIVADTGMHAVMQQMLAALITAREFISIDRNALADTRTCPDGTMEQDDADALADYDRALVQIQDAIHAAMGPV